MKTPTIRRILKDDLVRASSDPIPGWVDQMLEPLNQFIDSVVTGLRNQLTFGDNFASKIISVKLTHAVETQVNPSPLKSKVIGIIPLSFDVQFLDSYNWNLKSSGLIGVTFKFVNTSATNVPCSFLLITG